MSNNSGRSISNASKNIGSNIKKTTRSGFNKAKNTATKQYNNFNQSSIGKKILIVLVILAVIFLIAYWFKHVYDENKQKSKFSPVIVKDTLDAWITRPPQKIPSPRDGLELTFSTWIYIKDWNYKYGKAKNILWKGDPNSTSPHKQIHSPSLWLYPLTNSLKVVTSTTGPTGIESCDISNIPLQKWVHIGYVLNNRNVDVYINGKLERSCVLKGIPRLDDSDLNITYDKGFWGKIGRLQYFAKAIEPNQMAQLYADGPRGSIKYKVKFFTGGNFVETSRNNGLKDYHDNDD